MAISEANKSARAKRVGSSDAPTVMGVNPYKQPLELWREKTGRVDAPNLDAKLAIIMGNHLEMPIAQAWAAGRGLHVYADTDSYICSQWDKAVSHIDLRIEEEPNNIIEVKNRGARQAQHYGESGGDGGDVMPSDYVQCQHHMMCSTWDSVYLVVYLGGGDLRHFTIERDADYIDRLLDAEQLFWAHVEDDVPPEMDLRHRTSAGLIKSMYPSIRPDEIVTLGDFGQSLHEEIERQRQLEKAAKEAGAIARTAIQELLGESSFGLIPSGGGYRRKSVKRKAYSVAEVEYVECRYIKKAPV